MSSRGEKILIGIFGGAAGLAALVFGPKLAEAFASVRNNNDPVIDPIDSGVLTVQGTGPSSGGSAASIPGLSSNDGSIEELGQLDLDAIPRRVTVPFDEQSEFFSRIGPQTTEIVLEAPELFVSTESGQIVPTVRSEVITRNEGGQITQQTVFVDQFGNTFNSEQELLQAAVRISDEVNAELQSGTSISVIEALLAGKPVNTTNFLTERPTVFPIAEIDSDFQRRAQALAPSLTASNPGASSSSRVANFSRLAALGTDLSEVDIFGVQNPDFLGEIKTGQGPLTDSQKQLLDNVRLSIDPRNMTSSDFEEIRRNQERRRQEKAALDAEVAALRRAGLTPDIARQILNEFGFAVRGEVTLELFATLNDRFSSSQASQVTAKINDAKRFDVQKNLESATATFAGAGSRNQAIANLQTFLRQTGRTNLNNLAPAELFALTRLGFSNVQPLGGSSQPAIEALKLLL